MVALSCGDEIPDHLDLGTRMLHRKNISTSARKLMSYSCQIEYSEISVSSGNMFVPILYLFGTQLIDDALNFGRPG